VEERPLQKVKRWFCNGTDGFDRESSISVSIVSSLLFKSFFSGLIFRQDLFVGATVHSQRLLSLTTRICTGKESMKVSRESKSKLEVQLTAERPVITADGSDSSAAKKKRKEDADAPLYIKRI
jgi:hypothetical protein